MKFRTGIVTPKSPFQIDYHTKIFGLGSCFVDNMKEKFDYFQFQTQINPFGVIFNPVSIKNTLETIVEKRYFTKDDLFYHQNAWKSYQLHAVVNCTEAPKLLNEANHKIKKSHQFLTQSNILLITLGTVWVYKHKSTGQIVTNCHKVPQQEFTKELLSTTEIINNLQEIISLSKTLSKDIKILFTVSPIRHLKDGFVENNVSKARLIDAVYQVVDQQNSFYFPSYEMVMDDLRNYRFYKEDMIHPNEMAVNYIWQKLQESTMSEKTIGICNQVDKIRKSLLHKPFDRHSEQYQKFLEKIEKQIVTLQKKYEWMKYN
jgi:hypothetical protein